MLTAAYFGLDPDTLLQHPDTGSIQTASRWLDGQADWCDADGNAADEQEIIRQFNSLLEVEEEEQIPYQPLTEVEQLKLQLAAANQRISQLEMAYWVATGKHVQYPLLFSTCMQDGRKCQP